MGNVAFRLSAYFADLRAGQPVLDGEPIGCRFGALVLDHERREVRGTVAATKLSRPQYAVLARLVRRPGVIVEHAALIAAMYEGDPDAEPDTAEDILRGVVLALRRVLFLMGDTASIRSDRGVGYFVEEVRR